MFPGDFRLGFFCFCSRVFVQGSLRCFFVSRVFLVYYVVFFFFFFFSRVFHFYKLFLFFFQLARRFHLFFETNPSWERRQPVDARGFLVLGFQPPIVRTSCAERVFNLCLGVSGNASEISCVSTMDAFLIFLHF